MKVILVDKNDFKNNTLIDIEGVNNTILATIVNLCTKNDFSLIDITSISDSDLAFITDKNLEHGRPKYYVYKCLTCDDYVFYDYGLKDVHLDVYENFPNGLLGTVCTNCHSNHEDKELAKLIRDKIGNKVFEFNDEVYGRVELNES